MPLHPIHIAHNDIALRVARVQAGRLSCPVECVAQSSLQKRAFRLINGTARLVKGSR